MLIQKSTLVNPAKDLEGLTLEIVRKWIEKKGEGRKKEREAVSVSISIWISPLYSFLYFLLLMLISSKYMIMQYIQIFLLRRKIEFPQIFLEKKITKNRNPNVRNKSRR